MVDVTDRLEARRQTTELGPLRGLGVGPLEDGEDALEALGGGRVDVRHLGLELAAHRLTLHI